MNRFASKCLPENPKSAIQNLKWMWLVVIAFVLVAGVAARLGRSAQCSRQSWQSYSMTEQSKVLARADRVLRQVRRGDSERREKEVKNAFGV